MPRLMRKLPFMAEAREQVRGGLWYKPSWFDAVRKVPPLPIEGAIKKRDVPRMRMVEDRLVNTFEARNPMIAAHDHFDPFNPDPNNQASVAVQFVTKQLSEMRADRSEAAAYDVAAAWMVENGSRFYKRLDLPEEVTRNIKGDDTMNMPPKQMFETIMRKQMDSIKQGLERGASRHAARQGGKINQARYRNFLPKQEVQAIQNRQLGNDTVEIEVHTHGKKNVMPKSEEEFRPGDFSFAQLDVQERSIALEGEEEGFETDDTIVEPAVSGTDLDLATLGATESTVFDEEDLTLGSTYDERADGSHRRDERRHKPYSKRKHAKKPLKRSSGSLDDSE